MGGILNSSMLHGLVWDALNLNWLQRALKTLILQDNCTRPVLVSRYQYCLQLNPNRLVCLEWALWNSQWLPRVVGKWERTASDRCRHRCIWSGFHHYSDLRRKHVLLNHLSSTAPLWAPVDYRAPNACIEREGSGRMRGGLLSSVVRRQRMGNMNIKGISGELVCALVCPRPCPG